MDSAEKIFQLNIQELGMDKAMRVQAIALLASFLQYMGEEGKTAEALEFVRRSLGVETDKVVEMMDAVATDVRQLED